jgi:glutamate 5-kinase
MAAQTPERAGAGRDRLAGSRRWVVKIGSALLTDDGRGLNCAGICTWAGQMAALRGQGKEVVLVSSGSVAEGIRRLGWERRPVAVHQLQAAAAVGQMGLVQTYETCFQKHGLHTAQILLTHDDLSHRQRYLNARGTLRTLLDLGAVPVVNENDTVATDEIRFGDNDTLAALVANLVEADVLVILTDQAGLCERDPRIDPDASLISECRADAPELTGMAGSGSGALGRGGMLTKVRAARRAARSGASTLIAAGRESDVLTRLAAGEDLGTLLLPGREPLAARKQWLAGHLQVRGTLRIDDGAVRVLREAGSSLLPVGVTGVEGNFSRGEMVACRDPEGREVARGLVNYSAAEARRIMGQASRRIEALLGYADQPEMIHRDNLVLL